MKTGFVISSLLIPCLSSIALGQQTKLEGHVFDDKDARVSAARIVAPGGQAAETDSRGHFTIVFPSSVQPGQATRIEVVKPNWVIIEPLLGNCVTQSSARNYEPLKVIIVPKGSPLALSPKQLGRVIAKWGDERAKLHRRVDQLTGQLDEYAFLREYSEKYGFTLDQFVNAAQQWAQSKESSDGVEQALKEYFLKNYDRAAQLGLASAIELDSVIEQEHKKQIEDSRNQILGFKIAGYSFYEKYKFREALAAYEEIEKRFATRRLSKEDLIDEWAEIKLLLGNTKQELGARVQGQESQSLLSESAKDYQQALTVWTREQLPQEWAMTQNGLGAALTSQGVRVSGEESVRLLAQAVDALREALTVATRDQFPQDWAMTQTNLGNALRSEGERVGGEGGAPLLAQAVDALHQALTVRTRERQPQKWALTQNNLGIALQSQGERASAEESVLLLARAVLAFREALTVTTRDQFPEDWAATQNNLGMALASQGERSSGEENVRLLGEATDAFRQALTVYARDQVPQLWAATQNNLGNVLSAQGQRLSGAPSVGLLMKAVDAYHEALKVRTADRLPQDWAETQNNLGSALSAQAERVSGEESASLLAQAVDAYQNALTVRTPEHLPQLWAKTQSNLGAALSLKAERVSGEESLQLLARAVDAFRLALKVSKPEELPQQWAMTQNNLGNALRSQGERLSGEESERLLKQAVDAYRNALSVFVRDQLPEPWARTQNNLARAYFRLRDWPRAAQSYANVLSVYPDREESHSRASGIYQDKLFEFEKAFELSQRWLARHPDDISAQVNSAEKHFTTGRFAECEQRISALLTKPDVSVSIKIVLRAIEIADLLALRQDNRVPGQTEDLIAEVSRQPAEFEVERSFDGTRHFISENEKLSPSRAWLGKLFDALAGKDRETILDGLRQARARFKEN